MDNKILQQHLADALAERSNITKRKAEAFVRSFFEATENALISDGIVKVKGFGTTKIISVSERESVNINTGERFQIEGHDKITFTPDSNFRDLVNRPFAHFTTIILEDTVDEKELATEIFTDEEEGTTQNEEIVEEDTATTEETTVKESIVETTTAEKPIGEETAVEETIVEETIVEEAEKTSVESAGTHAETSALDNAPLIEIPTKCADDENHTTLNPENETDMQQQPIIIQNSVPTSPSHNWWKTAFIILITIVLMVLSYFAGYYRVFCPCETTPPAAPVDTISQKIDTTVVCEAVSDEVANHTTAETAQKATVQTNAEQKAAEKAKKAEAEKQQKATNEKNAAAKYKQMGGEYLITGVQEHHTMKAGDNLYKLAQKYYGDKKLATYIIFHNSIENPDVVGLGQTIEIPKLTKK